MRPEALQLIMKKVADSRKNFADHAFQNEVNSPYLKQIMDNISEMELICQEDSESGYTLISQRTKLHDSDKNDLLKIVYAMSRFDYPIISAITGKDYNQTEAFNYLEKITGVKSTTLKNMRDRFDPYIIQTRSKRKGWHQVELLPEYEKIKSLYSYKDEVFVKQELAEILDAMKKRA